MLLLANDTAQTVDLFKKLYIASTLSAFFL